MKILLCIGTLFALCLIVEEAVAMRASSTKKLSSKNLTKARGSLNSFKAKKLMKPRVIDFGIDTEDHKAYLGTTFNLSCTAIFRPVPSFTFIVFTRQGSRAFDIPGRYENFPMAVVNGTLRTSKLSLKNVTKREEGKWRCYGVQLGLKGAAKKIYVAIADPCPAGYYCPWNESKKIECPYGTYSDGSTNVTYQCANCPGEYPATRPKGYSGPAKSIQECPKSV